MLLEDIADFLASEGGYVGGTNLFTYGLKPAPDRQIALNQTGGVHPHGNMANDATKVTEQPTIQVLCRDAQATNAAELAETVFAIFEDVPTRTINGTVYRSIAALQSPHMLDRDDQRRELFVFNVLIRRALP